MSYVKLKSNKSCKPCFESKCVYSQNEADDLTLHSYTSNAEIVFVEVVTLSILNVYAKVGVKWSISFCFGETWSCLFYAERGTLTGAGVQGYSNLSKKRQSTAGFSTSLKTRHYLNMEIIFRM